MEDKTWAVKWRAYTVDDYCGERFRKIVKTRFSDPYKRPSCILISGPRGCGKTTFADMITKYYQCENPKPDGSPCEECDACKTINEVLIPNIPGVDCPGVIEVDATINRTADAIFDVIEQAMIKPVYSKCNIVIFDEAHMLSATAQNSLLKTIEQAPDYLKIFFMTTNPEKLIEPIKSRCSLTLEVKRQTVQEMASRLMTIAKGEKLKVSKEALELIARIGDRIPRECINILENVAKGYDGVVNIANIRDATDNVDAERYLKYYSSANEGLESILLFANKLKEDDIDTKKFVSGLIKFTINAVNIKHGINIEDFTVDFIKKVKEMFKLYTTSEFDMLLQIVERAFNNVSDDNNRNNLIIINTAMLISKVDMLANGVQLQVNEAVNENNMSLSKYSTLVQSKLDDKSIKYDSELNEETLNDDFNNMRVVNNSDNDSVAEILKSLSGVSGRIEVEDDDDLPDEEVSNISDTNDSIEDFFSNSEN